MRSPSDSPITYPITVATERCTGCGRCVAACGERLFTLETAGHRKHAAMISPDRCSRCLKCVAECPVAALTEGRA